ncbi:hypothetical protein ACLOJK_034960, partial [Asimina triloba]
HKLLGYRKPDDTTGLRYEGDEFKAEASIFYAYVSSDSNEDEEIIGEFDLAPQVMKDGGQPTIDELKEFNLGTEEDQRPIFISRSLPGKEKQRMLELLRPAAGTATGWATVVGREHRDGTRPA